MYIIYLIPDIVIVNHDFVWCRQGKSVVGEETVTWVICHMSQVTHRWFGASEPRLLSQSCPRVPVPLFMSSKAKRRKAEKPTTAKPEPPNVLSISLSEKMCFFTQSYYRQPGIAFQPHQQAQAVQISKVICKQLHSVSLWLSLLLYLHGVFNPMWSPSMMTSSHTKWLRFPAKAKVW